MEKTSVAENANALIKRHRLSERMVAALISGENGAVVQGKLTTIVALIDRGLATPKTYENRLTPKGAQLLADLRQPAAHHAETESRIDALAAEGTTPSNATHPNVIAARAALHGIKPAAMTGNHDVSEPTEAERNVRGYMVEPREGDRIAVYWLEEGRIVRRDDAGHGASLDCLAWKLERSGWRVEEMLRSSECVFAHRPAQDVPAPAYKLTPLEENTRRANQMLAGVDFGDPRCLHHVFPIGGVSGDPIKACARKQPNQEAGVFNDEGCMEAYDCAVQAANRAAEFNAEEETDGGDPLYRWDLMCPDHEGHTLDACEECYAEPDPLDT